MRKTLHRLLMLVLAGSAAHVVAAQKSLVPNEDNKPRQMANSAEANSAELEDKSTSDLTRELEKLAKDKQDLLAQNRALIQDNEKYRQQINVLGGALERKQQEIVQVQQRLADVEVKEDCTRRQLEEKQNQADELRLKNEEYREEVEDLKQTIERQQKELAEQEQGKQMMLQMLNFMRSITNSLQALPEALRDMAVTLHQIELNSRGEPSLRSDSTSDSLGLTEENPSQDSTPPDSGSTTAQPTFFLPL